MEFKIFGAVHEVIWFIRSKFLASRGSDVTYQTDPENLQYIMFIHTVSEKNKLGLKTLILLH